MLPECPEGRHGVTQPIQPPANSFDLLTIMTALYTCSQQIGEILLQKEDSEEQSAHNPDIPDPLANVDAEALRALVDMGFPEARASKALVLNNMSVGAAMDWLLQHADDPNVDQPLLVPPARVSKGGRTFSASPAVFQRLRDMGFAEQDALVAMELAHNNFEQAVGTCWSTVSLILLLVL